MSTPLQDARSRCRSWLVDHGLGKVAGRMILPLMIWEEETGHHLADCHLFDAGHKDWDRVSTRTDAERSSGYLGQVQERPAGARFYFVVPPEVGL